MIIDAHAHIGVPLDTPKRTQHLLDVAERFDIQWLCLSMGPRVYVNPTRQQVRASNDHVLKLMRRWPQRFAGYCYLNPRHGRFSLDELVRCVDGGMCGIKLWISCACNHRAVYPIVEHAIELAVPILQHTWKITAGNEDYHSEPKQMAELAERYPQASLIMAHAGGNWQYGVRAIRHCPNVCIDTSGGNPVDGMLEMALEQLGPDRILFGSDAQDRSFASQLARVDSARMSNRARNLILRDNARRLLGIR